MRRLNPMLNPTGGNSLRGVQPGGAAMGYCRHIITGGLVGRWFYGLASGEDVLGRSTIALQNSPGFISDRFSSALDLNGTNQYGIASSVNLGFQGKTQLSLCLRIKTGDTSGRIIQKEIEDGGNSFILNVISGALSASVQNQYQAGGFYYPTWTTSASIADNAWHSVIFAFSRQSINAADAVIYIDGSVASSTYTANGYSAGFTITEITSNLVIGARPVSISDFLSGAIADLRVYDRQLSAKEAVAYYKREG